MELGALFSFILGERPMVTAGIQGFKAEPSTQEGAELSIVQVCCAVPHSLQSPGQARAAAFCQLATRLLGLERLPYFRVTKGSKTGERKGNQRLYKTRTENWEQRGN